MKRFLLHLLPLLVLLFVLTGCKAYTLTDSLPSLIDPKTQLPEITSITVKRLSDGTAVELVEAAALNEMMLHVEGIRAVRTSESLESFGNTYPPLYEIYFTTDTTEKVLTVCGDEEFYMDGHSWLAVRGGMDLLFLDGLFSDGIPENANP